MRRRQKIILLSVLSAIFMLVVFCGAYLFFTFEVEVCLNGNKTVETEVFSEYKDSGAKGYVTVSGLNFKKEIDLTVSDNINNQKLGTYKMEYKASFLGKGASSLREIQVIDTKAPQIIAEESVTIDFEKKPEIDIFNLPITFTANDEYDGDLTEKVVKTYDKSGCTLTVSDLSGNIATFKVAYKYTDKKAPTVTIEDSKTVYILKGEKYTEITYTAEDNIDGDLTERVQILNIPDTSKPGSYTVRYEATDSSYNVGYAERKVVVYQKAEKQENTILMPSEKTVYLTFDDGPGQYTEELLKILKEYNVTVTFFVTDQFPKYRDLIGQAYEDGHSIGVHTYSHRFDNIYKSIENYLKDFEKIQSIIKEQTDKESKIFRFPGGSSNIVSKKYSTGIMKALVNEMTERGYVYFDWNYDCGDTSGYKKKRIVSNVTKHIKSRLKTEDYTIILLHDIKVETIKAVPEIIEFCLENGYTFAGLDENSPNRQFATKN